MPANPHPCQSSQCYQIPLRTGCCPRTGLSPTFCLSPPQTSPVTPIVDFSYRASQNIGRAISFRLGTRLECVSYRSFLLGGNNVGQCDHFDLKIARRKKKKTKKLSAVSLQSLFRCMNNKTNIWGSLRYAFFLLDRLYRSVTRGIRQVFSQSTLESAIKTKENISHRVTAQLIKYISSDNRDKTTHARE